MSVAVCIPTYNQAAYLEDAIRSALAQTHSCEVWVSDDASTDETPAVMARLCRDHQRIRYIRQEHNLGMSGNPRWIIQQPATDYIVKLDSDDVLEPRYVEKLAAQLEANPRAGYAHAAVREIDAQGECRGLRVLGRSSGFLSGEESLRASVSGYRVAANICIFRSDALKEVNYYKSDLQFADDWDLAVRLADAGWGNVYVSEVLARYRVWDTADGLRARRKGAELEGCFRVFSESLVPAFKRRGWDLKVIQGARQRSALRHAGCVGARHFSAAEKAELVRSLKLLGDSPALRFKLWWIRTPISPAVAVLQTLLAQAKRGCKRLRFHLLR